MESPGQGEAAAGGRRRKTDEAVDEAVDASDGFTSGVIETAVAAFRAARDLAQALAGMAQALLGLAGSEWRLARAVVPWVIGLSVVLIALAETLWLSLVAVLAWGFYVWTGSAGWAIAAVILVHLVLLLVLGLVLGKAMHSLTMPSTRAELGDLMARVRGREPGETA